MFALCAIAFNSLLNTNSYANSENGDSEANRVSIEILEPIEMPSEMNADLEELLRSMHDEDNVDTVPDFEDGRNPVRPGEPGYSEKKESVFSIFKRAPKGGWQHSQKKPHCEDFVLSQRYEARLSEASAATPIERIAIYDEVTKEFLSGCEKKLVKGSYWHKYLPLFEVMTYSYKLARSPKMMPVRIRFGDSLEVKAYLGLQDLVNPRPLVVFRCGLQCNRGSETSILYAMMLMDQSNFNILMLPSTTGTDYQRTNVKFTLGGIEESHQNIRLARAIRDSNFWVSDLVSSLHFFAISLGGQSSLFTGLLNGYNFQDNGKPLFDSVFAECPVVDLRKSLYELYDRSPLGSVLFWSMVSQIRDLIRDFPLLDIVGINPFKRFFGRSKLKRAIGQTVFPYYHKKLGEPDWLLPPMKDVRVDTVDEFWNVHEFQRYIPLLKSPVYARASKDDAMVRVKDNLRVLKDTYKENVDTSFGGKDPGYLKTLELKAGSHCMVHSAYGWKVTHRMLEYWFLYNSPEYTNTRRTVDVDATTYLSPGFARRSKIFERFLGFQWLAEVGSDKATLVAKFMDIKGTGSNIKTGFRKTRYEKAQVPLAAFGLRADQYPTNMTTTEAMTRWLNSNVYVWGPKKYELFNSRHDEVTTFEVTQWGPEQAPALSKRESAGQSGGKTK